MNFEPPKTDDLRIGLTLIKSCDDCMYSDLIGLDTVCRISNAKHGGEYISKECPLPKWNANFDSLIFLMWRTNLTWGEVYNIVKESVEEVQEEWRLEENKKEEIENG